MKRTRCKQVAFGQMQHGCTHTRRRVMGSCQSGKHRYARAGRPQSGTTSNPKLWRGRIAFTTTPAEKMTFASCLLRPPESATLRVGVYSACIRHTLFSLIRMSSGLEARLLHAPL